MQTIGWRVTRTENLASIAVLGLLPHLREPHDEKTVSFFTNEKAALENAASWKKWKDEDLCLLKIDLSNVPLTVTNNAEKVTAPLQSADPRRILSAQNLRHGLFTLKV